MPDGKCNYEGCNENVNSPYDSKYCLFHAPIDQKGISLSEFKIQLWNKRFGRLNYNFRGFIFPGKIYFRGGLHKGGAPIEFNEYADFTEAQFYPELYELNKSKPQDCADFEKLLFKRGVSFLNASFLGNVYFGEIEVFGDSLFPGANFHYDCSFLRSVFHGPAYFLMVYFKGKSEFNNCIFEETVDYAGTTFHGSSSFSQAKFEKTLSVKGCKISKIKFDRTSFGTNSSFYLIDPDFIGEYLGPRLYYDRIKFPPFFSFFEGIRLGPRNPQHEIPCEAILVFRNCQLKDTTFSDNKMSLFSFYKSSFDEAKFISSRWDTINDRIMKIFPYTRKNIMPEETLYGILLKGKNDPDENTKLSELYELEELNCFDEISNLYRKMKAALDRSKDYQEASWFYFNEMEMKRLAIIEKTNEKRYRWEVINKNMILKIIQKEFLSIVV